MPSNNLSALVIDANPYSKAVRVIISDAGNNSLLIFNMLNNNWWRLSITHSSKSADNQFVEESEKISFDELALSQVNNVLYATSSDRHELYSINLQELRNIEDPEPSQSNVSNTEILSLWFRDYNCAKRKNCRLESFYLYSLLKH